MNLERIRKTALQEMPHVEATVIPDTFRHNVIDSLPGFSNVGIELGVAGGVFSERMVRSGKFAHFFGVDIYADTHNTEQYKSALRRIGLRTNYTLLRMTFDDAIDLFEDAYFDFIYIDGFAHTGEEGGETLIKWFKKLKVGGIFAGDDYHDDWPLVKWAVNELVAQLRVQLYLTERTEEGAYCRYPTWFIAKSESGNLKDLSVSEKLVELGRKERDRIYRERMPQSSMPRKLIVRALDFVGLKNPIKKALGRNN